MLLKSAGSRLVLNALFALVCISLLAYPPWQRCEELRFGSDYSTCRPKFIGHRLIGPRVESGILGETDIVWEAPNYFELTARLGVLLIIWLIVYAAFMMKGGWLRVSAVAVSLLALFIISLMAHALAWQSYGNSG